MKKNIFTILVLLLSVCLFSCGDDDDNVPDLNETKKVKIEVDGSDNLLISIIVIAYSSGGTDSYTDLEVRTWSKEITYKGVAAVAVSGITSDGESGTMQVRLVKDGKVVSTGNSEGSILSANASH